MKQVEIKNLIVNNFSGTELESLDLINHARAIILTGSFGRKTEDQFSDVDIVVVVSENEKFSISGKFLINNTLFDFRTESIKKLRANWSDQMRFAYFYSIIVYDKDQYLSDLIRIKTKEFLNSIFTRVSIELVELSVLYCFKDNWRSLRTEETHFAKALKRNRIQTAAYIQNVILEKIINILYLANSHPFPDAKNRLLILKNILSNKEFKELSDLLVLRKLDNKSLMDREDKISLVIEFMKRYVDMKIPIKIKLKEIYFANRD